jgi:hypothetical protein
MRTFTEQAYLNYSMYVIMDRALPHIGDGLARAAAHHLRHERAGSVGAVQAQEVRHTVGDVW